MPTKIEWVKDADGNQGETWNPIRARNLETGGIGHFCVHVSPGCANCYAERLQVRFRNPIRYAAQDANKVELFLNEKALTQPLRWRKPKTIFVCSMTDLFLESVPDEWIDRVFAVMALAPHHRFQVLTKRAERMRRYMSGNRDSLIVDTIRSAQLNERLPGHGLNEAQWPLPNIWCMISAEDQKRADERIPELLATPAAVRGVSLEPLLGPIVMEAGWLEPDGGLDWVIVGGESGPGARPMHQQWARDLRDQCLFSGVAFHFKQWGEWCPGKGAPFGENKAHQWPDGTHSYLYGKKRAGRELGGRTWDEMPA